MSPFRLSLQAFLVATAVTATATSCNLFDPFDNPTSDAQLLSAAKAALDRGDFEAAMQHYAALSPDKANERASGEAYTILHQNGVGFGAFAEAFGTKPDGGSLAKLANQIKGADQTKRLELYKAYQKAASITEPKLQGLVKFLASAAISAEILAEVSGADARFTASDLAAGGGACNDTTACITDAANCGAPASNGFATTATNSDLTVGAPAGAQPTLDMLYSAIDEASKGLNATGATSTGTSFSDLLGGGGTPGGNAVTEQCFRAALISKGVGV